jgi:hypothetical protein
MKTTRWHTTGCRFSLVFCLSSGLLLSLAKAADRTPEQILPPTTQIYVRWDGVAAHQKAYDESARGKMFAGETGKALDEILKQVWRQLKMAQPGEMLLNGRLPDEVGQMLGQVKAVKGLPKLLAESGVVASFEIRPPAYDLTTLYNMVRGNANDRAAAMMPQFLVTVVIPGAADKPEPIAALRLLANESKVALQERRVGARQITVMDAGGGAPLLSVWAEEKHLVATVSNMPIEKILAKMTNDGAGITNHRLYSRIAKFNEFHVVTRGFIDSADIYSSGEKLIKAFAPEIAATVDATGAGGIKSFCFWDGFEGEESHGVLEIDIPGPRKGLTKLFKPAELTMAELPPLPSDLTRFTAARIDLAEIYNLAPLLLLDNAVFADNDSGNLKPEDLLNQHRERIHQQIDDAAAIKISDLLASLGDKVVTYQAPTDGILNLGQVLAVSVKDEKKLRRCLDGLIRKLAAAVPEATVVKRDCAGVEALELFVKGRSPVTISIAICDGWLVAAFQPQPVRGFILRSKGKLPVWAPDARTAATLAKAPADRCVIQVADPRPTLNWLYGAAPVVAGLAARGNEEPFLKPGALPHAGEASQHLFPNVMWSRDDGKVMRWESRDSLWLPLEVVGMEFLSFYFGAIGLAF